MISPRSLGIAVVAAMACHALSFDTGTHSDVTQAALTDMGFSSYGVKTARLENWLVDYYSNTGSYEKQLASLHFDNLPSTLKCRIYWGYFTNNTRKAVQDAARANNPFQCLCLLGMSLHAVQDFYAHSTWASTHTNANAFRTDTWFTNTPPPNDTGVYTGLYPNDGADENNALDQRTYHGLYKWGVNKDNINRPWWVPAEVFAYSATVQWAMAFQKWSEAIRPGFWKSVVSYNDATTVGDLDRDLVYLYYISLWVYSRTNYGFGGGSDGRWKAFGSGDLANFLAVAAAFKATDDDVFTLQFKPPLLLFNKLITNLYNFGGYVPGVEPLPVPKLNRTAVIVRTVSATDDTFFGINGLLGANYYAAINVGNQSFLETERPHQGSGRTDWLTLKLVPNTERNVAVNYTLWNQETTAATIFTAGVDELCDINPAVNRYGLTFIFDPVTHRCTGDVNGVFDSGRRVFTSSGTESNKSTVKFFVTAVAVQG